ncbi:MAG: sigma-54-dependent Fis family transcriptional regulator [Oligoflexia bacterium]|nr:sigma-54-dependent Fis family transcriptional regulator [Oligoflexia bacterium]
MELERNQRDEGKTYPSTGIRNLIVSDSTEMKSIMDIVERISKSNINIIISGESGTGKELIAREIHQKSNRAKSPFVVINCASLTEDLFDSDMFGHVKGSFTGAISEKTGYVERANKGTIYLDEITALSPNMQAKLLRFAQNGEYNRVGDSSVQRSDVRIISSTNKKLENEIKNNTIREDLFYRLNTIVLRIPPLRKRKEDIPALIRHFMSPLDGITPEAMDVLSQYPWPGNVRELVNIIERIKILLPYETAGRRNMITMDDIPLEIKEAARRVSTQDNFPKKLADIEREHILGSLQYFNSNKSKTASALGITLKTLYNKLNRYELEGWI